jgi:hypothetical protein
MENTTNLDIVMGAIAIAIVFGSLLMLFTGVRAMGDREK